MFRPLLLTAALLAAATPAFADGIVCAPDAPAQVKLAAKEIRRYAYLTTGTLLAIAPDADGRRVVLRLDTALAEQAYRLKTDGDTLVISGGSPVAVLYGAYDLAGRWGVRFYLHGDVVPDRKTAFALPVIDETKKPLFDLRGIQPFHDFPDGPDWWNRDDYMAYIGQLAKMRMNFIGLHCYPHRYDKLPQCGNTMIGPEPLVWQGLPQDAATDGTVKASYPSWWDNSIRRSGWPYAALKTSDYTGGAAQLFPTDDYGPEVMAGLTPVPKTEEQCNELFNRVGRQMGAVFSEAKKVGVKTCVGTETPMTVPPALTAHLKTLGKNPQDPKVVEELYEGTFRRMQAVMPADYYWLWTPEGWSSGNFKAVETDIMAAHRALKKIGSPMRLATCGWELGPSHDRGAMDKFLPKDSPMSCISSNFGHAGLIPSFADVTDRPKWAIPWMESDVNLLGYAPWVGRIRYDAADAKRLGCTGYMGIHWHVKLLMNNFAALAQSCWDQSYVPASFDTTPARPGNPGKRSPDNRTMPVADYYADFATTHFGKEIAAEAGVIFASIDGEGFRPDMTGWSPVWGAQGCLQTNSGFHIQTGKKGAIVERFAALRTKVVGAGNLERFDYWMNNLRASIAMYEAGAARGDMLAAMRRLNAAKDPDAKKKIATEALPLRIAMTKAWDKLIRLQILVTDSPGELGALSNLERNSRMDGHWLDAWDDGLSKALGAPLPAECRPSMSWTGPALIKMTTVRTSVAAGESLALPIIALDAKPVSTVRVRLRPLGGTAWKTIPAKHLARAVWNADLPSASEDFEYFVEAKTADGKTLRWPATAPDLPQTVIVE